MPRHFVYYRVPQAALHDAVAALRPLHAALPDAIELLRRPEMKQGLVTVMEIYTLDAAAAAAYETAATAALARWLDGQRHVEIFESLDAA